MENTQSVEQNNWSVWLIRKVIHPLTIFVTPLSIFLLLLYLVSRAFDGGFYPGMRSLAAVLLPLIAITFIFTFQKELLESLFGRIPTFVSLCASLIIGMAVMAVIQSSARFSTFPVTELVLSGSFTILVFSYVSLQANKVLSYYYGMITGFLLYIVLWGFPTLR